MSEGSLCSLLSTWREQPVSIGWLTTFDVDDANVFLNSEPSEFRSAGSVANQIRN